MAVYYPTPVDPIYNSHYHGGYFPTQAEYATSYGHPPVQYIPSHYSQGYAVPQVMTPQVVMQPSYAGSGHYDYHYHLSFGERFRRFFGLAPRGPFRHRYRRGTWGFMGFSRKPRYTDAYTGAEVDRKGRYIYRV